MSEFPQIPDSLALDQFAVEVQIEYQELLARVKREVRELSGVETVHDMLLERYCFLYAAMRHMERQWIHLDLMRYNQLAAIWTKITAQLLDKYKAVYEAGHLDTAFVAKVMTIVTEEVADDEILTRIRARFMTAMKEDVSVT